MRWKILAALGALLTVGAALTTVWQWRSDAMVLRACVAALAPKAGNLDVGDRCPALISADHLVASGALACDAALSARPENGFGVQAACSTPVKTVQAERDVARREAARLTEDLKQERLSQDAAIARATASATALAERKARAVAALKAAPRDGDGLVVCDADCLRARWGAAGERE